MVGKDGNLTGYGGTLDNKIKLLKLEKIDMTHLYRPKKTTKPWDTSLYRIALVIC